MTAESSTAASTVLVHYRVRPDAAEDNERLVREVFAELAARAPAGMRYRTFVAEDGVSFTHLAERWGEASLPDFAAFRAFTETLAQRCEEQPVLTWVRVVGDYP